LIGSGVSGGDGVQSPVAGERPLNWRQGILQRFPNGHAPITALTAAMKKKVTDDPEFNWWEREVSNVRLQLGASINTDDPVTATIVADPFGHGGGLQVKVGDLLRVENSGEIVRVTTVTSETSIAFSRSWGATAATAVTLGNNVNPNLHIMGSVNEEGGDTPENIRYRPTKKLNYTQIFRDSLKASRTAMQTRLRTVDEVRDAKVETLLYHSIRMEYAFLFGEAIETTGSSLPERTTGGIIQRITDDASANVIDEAGDPLKMSRFEELNLEMFRFGSNEKMGFCGNRAMLALQQMARYNSSIEITPAQKEFGMDVRRFFTPSGTLVLKTHPLFNQLTSKIVTGDTYYGMDSWLLIVDMGNLVYRPLRNSDTQYLPDRQANGVDGLTSEYLTECGLEVQHGKNHMLLKGLASGVVDS
jgi:hypothetical protein